MTRCGIIALKPFNQASRQVVKQRLLKLSRREECAKCGKLRKGQIYQIEEMQCLTALTALLLLASVLARPVRRGGAGLRALRDVGAGYGLAEFTEALHGRCHRYTVKSSVPQTLSVSVVPVRQYRRYSSLEQ